MKYWGDFPYYFNVYNVLEDQRMESHLVKGYLSYQKKFNKCLNGLGKNMDSPCYEYRRYKEFTCKRYCR